MLSFANSGFLWFTPLAVMLAAWWGLRRRPSLRYSRLALLDALPRGQARRAKWVGASLRGLAVLLLLVACAGPRRPDEQTRLPADGIAILMTLDVSGSMAERDAVWPGSAEPITRLEAAKRAFRMFLEPRTSDQAGLVTFAAVPQSPCPLTLNHSVLLRILDAQVPREGLDAGTNVGDAIAEAVLRLRDAGSKPKVLILLSDGEHNVFRDGPNATLMPRQAAQLAANLGITIYTIDAAGDPSPMATPEEQQQRRTGQEVLKAIAAMTGGKAFSATNGQELLNAYREIDEREKRPASRFMYRRYFEYSPWFAAAGLMVIVVIHVIERTRWRRLNSFASY